MIIHQDEKKRLFSIQILRCLACLMVFMVHWGQRVKLTGIPRKLTDIGAYGPALFFLISGYLAAKSLCGKNTPPH